MPHGYGFGGRIALAAPAQAAYHERPITLIVPWDAGGGTDAVARILAALLEKDLQQPVNIVNRIGSSGVVGHSAIAQCSAQVQMSPPRTSVTLTIPNGGRRHFLWVVPRLTGARIEHGPALGSSVDQRDGPARVSTDRAAISGFAMVAALREKSFRPAQAAVGFRRAHMGLRTWLGLKNKTPSKTHTRQQPAQPHTPQPQRAVGGLISEAKKEVWKTHNAFKTAIQQYKSLAGAPPEFIMEPSAPKIPASALVSCLVYPDRREMMIDLLPPGGRIAEIGTFLGAWAAQILAEKTPDELHLFDLTFEKTRRDVLDHPAVRTHEGRSEDTVKELPDHFFDWMYIDADHHYAAARKDIEVSIPKLKPGGILVFNDYLTWAPMLAKPYGVVTAVNELTSLGWNVCGLALTPNGYWDIALRRAI